MPCWIIHQGREVILTSTPVTICMKTRDASQAGRCKRVTLIGARLSHRMARCIGKITDRSNALVLINTATINPTGSWTGLSKRFGSLYGKAIESRDIYVLSGRSDIELFSFGKSIVSVHNTTLACQHGVCLVCLIRSGKVFTLLAGKSATSLAHLAGLTARAFVRCINL